MKTYYQNRVDSKRIDQHFNNKLKRATRKQRDKKVETRRGSSGGGRPGITAKGVAITHTLRLFLLLTVIANAQNNSTLVDVWDKDSTYNIVNLVDTTTYIPKPENGEIRFNEQRNRLEIYIERAFIDEGRDDEKFFLIYKTESGWYDLDSLAQREQWIDTGRGSWIGLEPYLTHKHWFELLMKQYEAKKTLKN